MLTLANRLTALGRAPEAYEVYQQFVTQCADYPDLLVIYHTLLDLAQKLGKKDDEIKYQNAIAQILSPHAQTDKWPAVKKGF
jgi:hypothetical protein